MLYFFLMKNIKIYTTNYCPFCVKAKSLLYRKKIKFSEIDVSDDETLREKMSAMANGARSVPQIFADNIHIGDCDKIHKLEQEKKLDKLLGLE
jgi:glutaredoxin 3